MSLPDLPDTKRLRTPIKIGKIYPIEIQHTVSGLTYWDDILMAAVFLWMPLRESQEEKEKL